MSLKKRLRDEILVGDGAMGTFLYQDGINDCFEELNLTDPEKIVHVHEQYIEAGADIIQTNTYAANSIKLRRYLLEPHVEEMNRSAVNIARQAARKKNTYVFGTIGGIGISYIHHSNYEPEDIRKSLQQQASTLLDADVDGFLLETFYDFQELVALVRFIRAHTNKPIIAHVTLGDIGVLQDGMPFSDALTHLEEEGVDVAGLNCRMGPHHMLRTLEEVPLLKKSYLSAYPNASLPNVRDGRYFYQSNPSYFGDMTEALVKEGIRLIGGCCGTTPEHVRAIRKAVTEKKLIPIEEKVVNKRKTSPVIVSSNDTKERIPDFPKSRHSVIVEMDPPKVLSKVSEFIKGAEALKTAGVDAVTLADNSLAISRIDNLSLGTLIKQQTGVRPLLHLACRDRNIIGLQSHLLGLHTLGIHDVLAITGDPAKVGDFPGATSVYDMSSLDLIRLIKRLNEGISFTGKELGKKTSFIVAAAFNANARHLEREVKRLEKKIEAGADYFMSQPVYSEERLKNVYEATKHLPVPVYVGIMPLVSSRNAEFLHHEVPGISLPKDVLEHMATFAGDREASEREGLALAKSLVDTATEYFQSIYLITPFLRYNMTVELTKHIVKADRRVSLQS